MNTKNTLLAIALMLCTGFVVSCGNDDEEEQPIPEEPIDQPTLGGKYGGWTQGSNDYAAYIPSDGDTLTVTLTNEAGTRCDLRFVSPTWGEAVLKDISIIKNDTAYLLSKPIEALLRDDHSAWDFSAPVDSIAMPNRNPQTETVTIKNYPITLEDGYFNLDGTDWAINFKAYLVPRSAHIQKMCFRDGKIGDM